MARKKHDDEQVSRIVKVEEGGIDPRLVAIRDEQKAAEPVRRAHHGAPATIDPKLVAARDASKAREAQLADRSMRKPPARG